ncbi:MAG: hypothetical protein GHCLOJNM_00893 [bacterium]|nr:hypothetical protein [bacterium]
MLARPYNLAPRIRAEESDSPHELCGTQVFLRPKATLLRVHETGWHPPTDIYETSDAYHVKIEMGGMHREVILSTQGKINKAMPRQEIFSLLQHVQTGEGHFCVGTALADRHRLAKVHLHGGGRDLQDDQVRLELAGAADVILLVGPLRDAVNGQDLEALALEKGGGVAM